MMNPTAVSQRCTIQLSGGDFCDKPRSDATKYTICTDHAIKISSETYSNARALASNLPSNDDAIRDTLSSELPSNPVVYYLRVGGLIKIGTTGNLSRRLRNYPPDAIVLGVEHGSTGTESERLKQFNQYLRHGKEWFDPSNEILSHIASLEPIAA